jgi:hypothetical protein
MENILKDKNADIQMSSQQNDEEAEISVKKKFLHTELTGFLKSHTVYETIPENMKVK